MASTVTITMWREMLGRLACGVFGHVYGSTKTLRHTPTPDGMGWAVTSATCRLCGRRSESWKPYP